MKLSELLEQLNVFEAELTAAQRDDDPEIVVHQQPNYPLAGGLSNVRWGFREGKLQLWLASSTANEYGTRNAWEPCETLTEVITEDKELRHGKTSNQQ